MPDFERRHSASETHGEGRVVNLQTTKITQLVALYSFREFKQPNHDKAPIQKQPEMWMKL